GVRAALCSEEFSARMARQHNNANVLALGGRTTGVELAKSIVEVFLQASFQGDRHARRVDLICSME
ncbi:MAG TPA: RpiB/LacA/LacB family sugar-phosphate isomerase, partial [Tissierellia bacterium]|nr:RpiB/LacA/LacB family sugar-phosphate isomerase [Tissierellia bacterium]